MVNLGLVGTGHYPVWHWQGDADAVEQDPAVSHVLDLLDPVRSLRCVFCGLEKEAGSVTCVACSRRCPDPDCRGTPRWVKDPYDEICQHCEAFVRRLDAPCRGRPQNCDQDLCESGRNASGDSNSFECFGQALERDGYFVYQLETGYVGMTYNPSRRQFEHDRRENLQRYINSKNDIENPGAYFRKAFNEDIDDRWEAYYSKHWLGVRMSDKNAAGERRISWLSPVLKTRNEAYRCEWALKQYRHETVGLFPGTYDEVVNLSSMPIIVFQSAGLDYNAETERVSFNLSWDLPHGIGPSQVIPVSRYELQRFCSPSSEYVPVASGLEPGFRGQLDLDLVGDWRARAVNFDDIPGPWANFTVSHQDVARGVQKLVGVADVTAELFDNWKGEVLVRWSVDNPVPGVHYEVEREGIYGSLSVIDVGSATALHEIVIARDASSYQYRVRAVLDGVGGGWQSGGEQSRCVVGGVVPGPVVDLSSRCQSDGSIDLHWRAPEWLGHDPVQGYYVEIVHDGGNAEYAGVRTATNWYDADSRLGCLSDVSYRVRAWNALGSGPWSDPVQVRGAARQQSVRSALSFSQQLQAESAGADWFSLRWDSGVGNGLSYDLEVNTDDEVVVYPVAEPLFTVPISWSSVTLMTCRVRAVRRGVAGDWSEPVAVNSAGDYESALGFVLPNGVNLGFVVIGGASGYSLVAVWSGRDVSLLTRVVPEPGSSSIGACYSQEQGRVGSVLVRLALLRSRFAREGRYWSSRFYGRRVHRFISFGI